LRFVTPSVDCQQIATGARACVTPSDVAGVAGPDVIARARSLITDGASGIQTIGRSEVFVDVFVPPPALVIVSAGDDARQLARCANDVGFRTIVVDRRQGLLSPDRFPAGVTLVEARAEELSARMPGDAETYAVVMMHNYADDRAYVRALLTTDCAYIGMLGPRQRTERIVAELASSGPVDESRIYGPVGLDIGTDGAEQVALAVVAEILAVRSGRTPTSLRERRRPIHAATGG